MLESVLKLLFFVISLVSASMIVYGKLFVFRKRKPQFISDYCATLATFIGFYSFLALSIAFLYPNLGSKVVMLLFAISPFIIGLFAKYETEKYYTALQVLLIVVSTAYVVI